MAETGGIDHPEKAVAAAAMSRVGNALAWLGITPFVVLSLWLFAIAPDHPWREGTIDLLVMYGALFLSFLGGVRWGLAISGNANARPRDLVASAAPLVAGWAAFAIQTPHTFAALAVIFAAVGAWDAMASHAQGAPPWYGKLRVRQTAIIVATMVLAFAATG